MPFTFEHQKMIIDAVCAVTTDEWTMRIALWVKLHGFGRAATHLRHYLNGNGTPLRVSLKEMIEDNDGIKRKLHRKISTAMKGGQKSGSIFLDKESDFDVTDWINAVGNLWLSWEAKEPATHTVELWFTNWYAWYPDQKRTTQCVHQAAYNLQEKGARVYVMYGSARADFETWEVKDHPFVRDIPVIPPVGTESPKKGPLPTPNPVMGLPIGIQPSVFGPPASRQPR